MGFLTDPSLSQRNKFGRNLVKQNRKICFVFYLAGLVWFCCLGHTDFNHATYLSENALSPGLVYSEVKQETGRLAQSFVEELLRERDFHKSTTPHSWILAKMKQIGLETHIHNFTLNYPLGGGKVFHGKNVYGILRAPRIGSTEGIVFSAPYRPPNSVHADIVASVPLLLAFADAARKKNYWAKDLIFLVTEQEQLGMHAWLEAYYKGGKHDSSVLNSGNLPARAGALQAALNLEIQDLDSEYINVKIEGLNGQLPNLDMFNLVQRLTAREGISSGYKQTSKKKRRAIHSTIKENINHMVSMIVSQASGVPTGNHGLFHRFRIESVTLEAVKRLSGNSNNRNVASMVLLKTVEGISRSLNNLLERFHQSYFFYLLVQNDRFVSIGDFMPCLVLFAGSLIIKAFLLWLGIDEATTEEDTKNMSPQKLELPYIKVLIIFGVAGLLGLLCSIVPKSSTISDFFAAQDVSTEVTVTVLLTAIVVIGTFVPFIVHLKDTGLDLLHVGALLFLASAIIVIGLLNFALGFIVAIISTPLAIVLNTKHTNKLRILTAAFTFVLNPLVVIYLIVVALTLVTYPELSISAVALRAITASMDAIAYGLVDSLIYGNWLYSAVTGVFFPLWILFWSLCMIKRRPVESETKLKTN